MDGPTIWEDEENVYYRASALGSCIRSLVAIRKGIEPNATSDKMQGYYDEGIGREEEILDKFHDKLGKKAWVRSGKTYDEKQIMLYGGQFNNKTLWIVGHYDEELTNRDTGEIVLAEAKFLAQSSYRNLNFTLPEPLHKFPYYAWQRDCYMVARKTPLYFVVGIKEREDDEDKTAILVDVVYSRVDKPVNNLVAIIKRLRHIEELAMGDLPACDFHQFPCPFYGSVCAGKELSEKIKKEKAEAKAEGARELEGIYAERFDAICSAYEYGRVLSTDGEQRKEQARTEFMALWEEIEVETVKGMIVKGDKWKIEWEKYPRQGNVDWKKVPEDLKKQIDGYRGKSTEVEFPKVSIAAENVGKSKAGDDLAWTNENDPQRKLDYVPEELANRLAPSRKTIIKVGKYKGE